MTVVISLPFAFISRHKKVKSLVSRLPPNVYVHRSQHVDPTDQGHLLNLSVEMCDSSTKWVGWSANSSPKSKIFQIDCSKILKQ